MKPSRTAIHPLAMACKTLHYKTRNIGFQMKVSAIAKHSHVENGLFKSHCIIEMLSQPLFSIMIYIHGDRIDEILKKFLYQG